MVGSVTKLAKNSAEVPAGRPERKLPEEGNRKGRVTMAVRKPAECRGPLLLDLFDKGGSRKSREGNEENLRMPIQRENGAGKRGVWKKGAV